MSSLSWKWTPSELDAVRNWKGRAKDLKLKDRTPQAIQSKRRDLECNTKHMHPWSPTEDTILRFTPAPPHAYQFFMETLHWRNPSSSSERYRRFIAPLLGKGDSAPISTKFDTHVLLARSDEERENLHKYYFGGAPEGGEEEEDD